MAQVIPSTPDPMRARGPVVEDKENMPPPHSSSRQAAMMPSTPAGGAPGQQQHHGEASTPARSSCMTPASKLAGGTAKHMFASTPLAKAPAMSACTPSGQTGTMPKTLDEWHEVLIGLPTATNQDRARLFRLYERALGSGQGTEELDVASHKDNEAYISLWLRRIRLDPEEGASYMKFMRKWHIGTKCAAVYVQQALTAPEKAAKALQEGIDAGAQPSELLADLHRKISETGAVKESVDMVLSSDTQQCAVVRIMLGRDVAEHEGGDATQSARKATDAPSAANSARDAAQGNGSLDDTVVGSAKKPARGQHEETVSFGQKLTEARSAPKSDEATDTVTFGRRSTRRSAAMAKEEAPTHAPASAPAVPKEETVVFGAQVKAATTAKTASSGAKAGAAKADAGAVKKTSLRGIKRTGLGSGPARRIVASDTSAAEDDKAESAESDGPGEGQVKIAGNADEVAPLRQMGKKILGVGHMSSMSGAGCSLGTPMSEIRAPSLSSLELAPINEGEASSGSEANSSISSGGSNDSVNRSVDLPAGEVANTSVAMSDQTTKPISNADTPASFADEATLPMQTPLRPEPEEELELFFDDMASMSMCSKEERQVALCKGHTAQFTDEQVPKGHIAVCDKIYKKIEVKGKGGGGKVYKVHLKENPESIWAIKKIKLDGDDEVRDSVFNEIELLLRLRGHSCIIHMEDYEIGDDYVYMVMECGDQDLAQALQKRQVRSLRGVWRAMIDSVQVVHDERVVHGDLKPANFLMVKKELKLIDFGIAKSIEGNDTTNIVRDNAIGTLNYMAPEAFLGNQGAAMGRKMDGSLKLGRPSDVWSMGCILYQMVYGKPPFHNLKNTVHKMQAITSASHQIEFPSTGASGPVEPELLSVLKTTLERDPAKRPTIPQLRSHPWLVPVKYALDSYNILVMVSKVRALHKEHKDISDAQIKDELVRLMNAAGLAIQEPPPPLPPKQLPQATPQQSNQAPPPQPPKPPPPPPSASASKVAAPQKSNTQPKSSAIAGAGISQEDIARAGASLKSVSAPAPVNVEHSSASSTASGVPSQQELLAQRSKLKKVPDGAGKPPAAEESNDMAGVLRERMQYIRSRVAEDLTGQNGNTGDFTSDFTKTQQ